MLFLIYFKQKPAYELRIIYWSSDVCSSDLRNTILTVEDLERTLIQWGKARIGGELRQRARVLHLDPFERLGIARLFEPDIGIVCCGLGGILRHERCGHAKRHGGGERGRSEEHTSELQSLMRISYAVFCLKKKKNEKKHKAQKD